MSELKTSVRQGRFVAAIAVLVFAATSSATVYNVPGDFPTIQAAIAAIKDGDEVVVAPGVYNEAIDFLGKAIIVRSSDGPDVTIIDAQQTGTVVTCDSAEGPDSVLEGFTITGGNAPSSGGGMFNNNSSPTISNCWFIQNTGFFAGGMQNDDSSPTVTDCVFSANNALAGGGMSIFGGSPTISNCTFSGNSVGGKGGGIWLSSASALVTNCTFIENIAGSGGAIYDESFVKESHLTLIESSFIGNTATLDGGAIVALSMSTSDCSFTDNSAGRFGGAMYLSGAINGQPAGPYCLSNCLLARNDALFGGGIFHDFELSILSLVNCTITNNAAGVGGGIITDYLTVLNLDNSILWDNQPEQIINDDISIVMVSYSNIQGDWSGPGNINSNPLFVDVDDNNFRLSSGSPCIDAADNTAVPKGITTDLDGNPRFVDDPDTKDTGNGDPPIVDMGAYEFQPVLCPWDLDKNGSIGASDLLALLASWGPCKGCLADFDDNGSVGASDLLALLANWGACP